MGRDLRGRLDAAAALLSGTSWRQVDGADLVGTALFATWGYLLVVSSGLIVNGAGAPLAVGAVDAGSLLFAAAGVATTWWLLAGGAAGYVASMLVTWAAVLLTVLADARVVEGLWSWEEGLVVLVLAGLYLFVRHDRFLPASDGST